LASQGDVLIKPSLVAGLLDATKKVTVDTNGGNLVILANSDGMSQGGLYVANADLKTYGGNLTIAGSRSTVTSSNFNTYISSTNGGWISPDGDSKSAPGPVGTLSFNTAGWFSNDAARTSSTLAVYLHSNVTIDTSGPSSAGNLFIYTQGKNDSSAVKTNTIWVTSGASITSKQSSLSSGVTGVYNSDAPSEVGSPSYTVTAASYGGGGGATTVYYVFDATGNASTYGGSNINLDSHVTFYSDALHTTTVAASSLGTVTYAATIGGTSCGSSCLSSNNFLGSAGAGIYTVSVSAISSASYALSGSSNTNRTQTVSPRDLTLSASNRSAVYGNGLTLGASSSNSYYSIASGSLATGDAISSVTYKYGGSSSVATSTAVATYANGIVPSAASGTGGFNTTNYNITYANGDLTISQRDITIKAADRSTTYGTALTLGTSTSASNYSITSGSLRSGDSITAVTYTYDGNTSVAASAAAITYSGGIVPSAATSAGGFNSTNYNITYVAGDLVVGKKNITITASDRSTTYGTALSWEHLPILSLQALWSQGILSVG